MNTARPFDGPIVDRPTIQIEAGPPRRGFPWLASLVTVLVVLALAPLAAVGWYQYEHQDRIFRGVSALGIDLSAMTVAEAGPALDARARTLTTRPVVVRAGDNEWRTDWGKLGLQLPTAPILEEAFAVGREGNPLDRVRTQIEALRGGAVVGWDERFDLAVLSRFVQTAAAQVERPMRNARLDMRDDLTFELTSAQIGYQLDVEESLRRLRLGAETDAAVVELPIVVLQPQTTDELRLPAKQKAEAILAAPLTLQHGEKRWTIERRELADLLLFTGAQGGPLDVKMNWDLMLPRVENMAAELTQEPSDALLEWNGGNVRPIRPSKEGRKLDPRAALQAMSTAVERGERTVALPVEVARPRVDSTRIAEMGLRELIDGSTTSFAGALPQKAHNVKLAASRLHGQVIAPGEMFSFNKALGPTTIDNGYQVAFAIVSAGEQQTRTVPSVAGGICQVATTLFQPVFWAGYQIEERNWHLYWIPAYTSKGVVGLDATVDEDANLDFQFMNNSTSYLLIQSKVEGDKLAFELYGTKPTWNVKVDGPKITDQKPADPTPVVEPEPGLPEGQRVAVESAREGFTASFVRTVTDTAGGVRTLRLESRYVPSRNVTLLGTGGRPTAPRGGATELNRPAPAGQ